MDEFDDKLRSALQRGARVEIGGAEIGTARELVTEIFRLRSKTMAIASVVKIAAAHVLSVFAGVMTFLAEGDRERFLWGFGSLFALVALGILWQFHWAMLNRNAVLRELKRLELQLADRAPN